MPRSTTPAAVKPPQQPVRAPKRDAEKVVINNKQINSSYWPTLGVRKVDDDNWNARSYLTHHMQRISSDIVMATADQLIAAINITKRSATGAAY